MTNNYRLRGWLSLLLALILSLSLVYASVYASGSQAQPACDITFGPLCDKWTSACIGMANDVYNSCLLMGGTAEFCHGDYARTFNSCMAGTGCYYLPYPT